MMTSTRRVFLPSPVQVQRTCSCGGGCESCRKKKAELQRSSLAGAREGLAPPLVHEVLRSAGRPLDLSTRSVMEQSLGGDFSRVRIHDGPRAAQSAEAVQAAAYTVGRHVVFGRGAYAPGSAAGRRLLAHELMHTVQQGGAESIPGRLEIGPPGDAAERQAERAAAGAGPGSTAALAGPPMLRRVISPASSSPEAEAARKAIDEAKKALESGSFSPDERKEVEARIAAAEEALRQYVGERNKAAMNPLGLPPVMAGVRTEGMGVGPAALLGAALGLGALLFANPEAVKKRGDALEELKRKLRELEVKPRPVPTVQPKDVPKPVEVPKVTELPKVDEKPKTDPGPKKEPDKKKPEDAPRIPPRRSEPKAYPICWATQLRPPSRIHFVRVKGAARDLDDAKQARMILQWREFRDPTFDPKRFHVHHVDPLFLGGADDLKTNGTLIDKENHIKGHYVLARQPQMLTPPAGLQPLPPNLYEHPAGTPYRLVGFKERAEEKGC